MKEKKSKKIYERWQPFGVGCKKQRGISVAFVLDENDLDLYRELLIKDLEMPESPVMLFYVVDIYKVFPWPLKGYIEASVCILGKHPNGTEGWYPFTMPVTGRLALLSGVRIGYPKFKPDSLTLKPAGDNWVGILVHNGVSPFILEYSPADVVIPWKGDHNFRGSFFLRSKQEGKINQMDTIVHKEKSYTEETGIVKIKIDSTEPWAKLMKSNKKEVPGIFYNFEGKSYLTRKDRKPI